MQEGKKIIALLDLCAQKETQAVRQTFSDRPEEIKLVATMIATGLYLQKFNPGPGKPGTIACTGAALASRF